MVNSKKNLLIVSPALPQPDLCAGDYRVWHLAKELSKHFNVFFMPLKKRFADGQNRSEFKMTAKKIFPPSLSKKKFRSLIGSHGIDFCLFEKYWDMPFDAVKLISESPVSAIDVHEIGYVKTAAMSKLKNVKHQKLYKAKELIFYKDADMLIAINEKEEKELKKIFPEKQTAVVPTCVKIGKKAAVPFSKRKNICYFGFYGHRPNSDAVNYFSKNIFPALKQKLPDVEFHVLGNGSKIFEGKFKDVKTKDNVKNIGRELSKYKVFVCPLRYGAGLKKKILDAMNAKTPVIASSYGFEGIKRLEKKSVSPDSAAFAEKIAETYLNGRIWNKTSKTNFGVLKNNYSERAFAEYVKACAEKIKVLV